MEKDKNVFFKELNEKEKASKLVQLAKSQTGEVVLWKKGSADKFKAKVVNYFTTRKEIQVEGELPEDFFNDEVLFSFVLTGVHYFGQCKVLSFAKTKIYLDPIGKIFKSERRANFRLLTFPHHQVYLHIQTDDSELHESNVINFQTKVSETGIFKDFLGIINDKDGGDRVLEGYIKLRVNDVSVTGLNLQLSDLEKTKLPLKKDLGEVILEFNDIHIPIPGAQILYILEGVARDKKTKIYRAGVQFLNLDTNTDQKLAGLINKTLRHLESEFEDFLK
ncbi:MAG: hypothetical protein CME65_11055 [Halobacteriovoraceae bacterium]|nr:hypothetical protein [Halobacteriovoraceae bacterium]